MIHFRPPLEPQESRRIRTSYADSLSVGFNLTSQSIVELRELSKVGSLGALVYGLEGTMVSGKGTFYLNESLTMGPTYQITVIYFTISVFAMNISIINFLTGPSTGSAPKVSKFQLALSRLKLATAPKNFSGFYDGG